jgi:hypothetical protein
MKIMAILMKVKLTGESVFTTNSVSISMGQTEIEKECYIRVNQISGTKDELKFTMDFLDNESREHLMSKSFIFVPSVADNAANFIKQCYEYAKTLPEFAGYIDVV